MDEFSLIDYFFKSRARRADDLILGIGDDAAGLRLAFGEDLWVSTDTLVADVHFGADWDPYDIAYKAIMVNLSDLAAMAARPKWVLLALTLPNPDPSFLQAFSNGLFDVLNRLEVSLVGGDMTKGPLSITITVLGSAPQGQALRRQGGQNGDKIYVSGYLGAAAFALKHPLSARFEERDYHLLQEKLKRPEARVDLTPILQKYASACIDVSDGLTADLSHILKASALGACLDLKAIPLHPLIRKYHFDALAIEEVLDFALYGGDDYELCFTIPAQKSLIFEQELQEEQKSAYCIGFLQHEPGLTVLDQKGRAVVLASRGYRHF